MIVHLASQIICDTWAFKARKEAQLNRQLTNVEIADLYKNRMPDASKDEEARSAPTTIKNAIYIYETVFSNTLLRNVVLQNEKTYLSASPFNSIGKLMTIAQKCKTTAKMEWTFLSLHEALKRGNLEPEDLSSLKLRGQGHKIGMLDLVLASAVASAVKLSVI